LVFCVAIFFAALGTGMPATRQSGMSPNVVVGSGGLAVVAEA